MFLNHQTMNHFTLGYFCDNLLTYTSFQTESSSPSPSPLLSPLHPSTSLLILSTLSGDRHAYQASTVFQMFACFACTSQYHTLLSETQFYFVLGHVSVLPAYLSVLPAYLSVHHVDAREEVADPLELESQMFASHHVSSENQDQSSPRAASALKC